MKYLKDIIYIITIILLSTLLFITHLDDNFNILEPSDWVNLTIGILGFFATLTLGIVAIIQNKKAHNINDRMLNIEESNNKTLLYFDNAIVPIKNINDKYWQTEVNKKLSEDINLIINNDIDIEKEHYLFLPTGHFVGKIPANTIIVNGYSLEKVDINTKKILQRIKKSKTVINNIQCSKEEIDYDIYIGLYLDDKDIKNFITPTTSLRITLDLTVKNIMGINNEYYIQCLCSYIEPQSNNNFYYMNSTVAPKINKN